MGSNMQHGIGEFGSVVCVSRCGHPLRTEKNFSCRKDRLRSYDVEVPNSRLQVTIPRSPVTGGAEDAGSKEKTG